MRLSSLSFENATASKAAIQAEYELKEIGGVVNAVMGQISSYFVTTIPAARAAEYAAADNTKKNNFAIITANAQGAEYSSTAFLTAWQLEYAKIYP